MSTTRFTRLSDAELRSAWPDEARDFTPWLFDNIDFLSDALGIELEATEIETAVENFSADIIAKDARTGDRVLIENQLEASDHKHLGQILTYLAGIEAKSIVWVAREFQEAHRSAIRWLNEHTLEDSRFLPSDCAWSRSATVRSPRCSRSLSSPTTGNGRSVAALMPPNPS